MCVNISTTAMSAPTMLQEYMKNDEEMIANKIYVARKSSDFRAKTRVLNRDRAGSLRVSGVLQRSH